MSYTNIHKVDIEWEGDDEHAVPMIGDHNMVTSYREGEEFAASGKLLTLLDDLSEGEALVVWRNVL